MEVQELYTPLFLYVRKRVNHKEDAEDLTQEVFLKLANSDSSKIDNVKSWVYTIARNTITDFYRKKKVYIEEIEDSHLVDELIDERAIKDLSDCIEPFIHKLPEEVRDIMLMTELNNISQKEVAAKLNMNYTTVRSKVQRGRAKLKEIFSDCCVISQGAKGSIMDYTPRNQQNYCDTSKGE